MTNDVCIRNRFFRSFSCISCEVSSPPDVIWQKGARRLENRLLELKFLLKERLSPARFQHAMGVMNLSRELASLYGADIEKAAVAGLLHDIARELSSSELMKEAQRAAIPIGPIEAKTPLLLHGAVGAALVRRELLIEDPEILEAIADHITGASSMSLVAQIVFLADFAEPNRRFSTARFARELAKINRLMALEYVFNQEIIFAINQGFLVHPKTVEARNRLLQTGDI